MSRKRRPCYPPIEDHGVIGDLHSVALVSKTGELDFLCLPSFESPSIFASILDSDNGGYFRIAPILEEATNRQLYLPDSNILLTRFLSEEGVAELSDLMTVEPERPAAHNVVRRAKTVRGEVRYRMECRPRFGYGRLEHGVDRESDRCIAFDVRENGQRFVLHSSVPMRVRNGDAVAEFTLGANESADFVLEMVGDGGDSPCSRGGYVPEAFKRTLNFWRTWIGRSTYTGRWREMVNRSALALKLLGSARHGSFVAAPTFGLPEVVGGERNWDYRMTWIRDTSFILYALLRLGYVEEAGQFMGWIAERCSELETGDALQVLYGIDGSREMDEEELPGLEGYRGSKPVRVGNAAYKQLQLDIYGELMDSIYLYDKFGKPISIDLWNELKRLMGWLQDNWQQPDEGIWEVRGGRKDFLYSRVLCWVAFDRAIRLARRRSLPGPIMDWLRIRDAIHSDVMEHFWSENLKAFVQCAGSETLDASALVLPLVRFIGPTDPRWLSTLKRIEETLVTDSLVHRYKLNGGFPDGLKGREGTFSLCSFWYVECHSRAGDLRKARLAFEKMLGYANHLGLYAEELGPSGEHLGNFPQAFTHVGLISAAYDLNRRLEEAGES